MHSCMRTRRRNIEIMAYRDVIIIDDGVNEQFIGNFRLKYDLEVNSHLEIAERNRGEPAVFSHGTICAAILLKYAPAVSVGSIKVVDTRLQLGSRQHLAAALRWCLNQEPMLIHLSIGTAQSADFDEIREIVSRLYRKGFLIIAAYDNHRRYTVPAALECVIGVRHTPESFLRGAGRSMGCREAERGGEPEAGGTEESGVREGEFEVFAQAPGEHDLTLWDGRHFRTPPCNSFAAPCITARIYHGIQENFSGETADVWKLLGREEDGPFCFFPDFLDCGVVIDESGDEWPELFYFRSIAADDGGALEPEEKGYLVLLAEETFPMEAFLAKLAPWRERVKGIFCCWKGIELSGRNLHGFRNRIWKEQDYIGKYSAWREEEDGEIEVPVIYLYGERRCLVEVMQLLKRKFLESGYNVKAVGQFQRAYLYGFEYIDSPENRRRILCNIDRRFGCDVILCGMASREMCHDLEDVSFWLWGGEREGGEAVIAVPIEEGKEAEGVQIILERIFTMFQADEVTE